MNDTEKVVAERLKTETDKDRQESEKLTLELITVSRKSIDGNECQKMLSSTDLENILTDAVMEVMKTKKDAIKYAEYKKKKKEEKMNRRPEPNIIERVKSLKGRQDLVARKPTRRFTYFYQSIFGADELHVEEKYHAMRLGK